MYSMDHMSTWSNIDKSTRQTIARDDFIAKVERCIYENEPMSDEEVESECRLWAQRFPHLRIIGRSIGPKSADNNMEALRMAIARKLVKNYLWNSVVEAIEAEVRKSSRGSIMTPILTKDKRIRPQVESTKLPSISPKRRSATVSPKPKHNNK
uniref:DUF3719 domain-containing protein n=1 Tax=Ascaris lumbricoides TaxID=6252 RepID=A0A0M3HZL0_ASCLU